MLRRLVVQLSTRFVTDKEPVVYLSKLVQRQEFLIKKLNIGINNDDTLNEIRTVNSQINKIVNSTNYYIPIENDDVHHEPHNYFMSVAIGIFIGGFSFMGGISYIIYQLIPHG